MRASSGWVPNYHGAWAMIIAPPVTGILLSTFRPQHLVFLAAWWIGYFAFFAGTKWLRARRKARFQKAVVTYGTLAFAATLALLVTCPYLIVWAPAYLPLIALTAFLTWKGRERSLLNDAVTVLAAGLTTPVAAHIGHANDWTHTWVATFFLTAYFIGTAFYVKTNIRERGNTGFLYATGAYHAALTAAGLVAHLLGYVSLLHVLVWVVLTVRSVGVAYLAEVTNKRISPKHIGFGEVAATIAIVATLMASM